MLEQIHIQRSKIAIKHQAKFIPDIQTLNDELKQLNLKHPYSLTSVESSYLLKKCDEYCNGGCCNDLKAKCDDDYLFRYTTIDNLTKLTTWENSLVPRDNAFEIIKNTTSGSTWFPLSKAMTGFYRNRRGFSWWTNELPDKIEKLFQLGLVSDWIMPKSLIMRIKITDRIKVKLNIPSVIDGYDQPIFLPKFIAPSVFSGQTLNLNDLVEFKNGLKEIVVSEIDISDIEVKPLELNVNIDKLYIDDIESYLLKHYNKY